MNKSMLKTYFSCLFTVGCLVANTAHAINFDTSWHSKKREEMVLNERMNIHNFTESMAALVTVVLNNTNEQKTDALKKSVDEFLTEAKRFGSISESEYGFTERTIFLEKYLKLRILSSWLDNNTLRPEPYIASQDPVILSILSRVATNPYTSQSDYKDVARTLGNVQKWALTHAMNTNPEFKSQISDSFKSSLESANSANLVDKLQNIIRAHAFTSAMFSVVESVSIFMVSEVDKRYKFHTLSNFGSHYSNTLGAITLSIGLGFAACSFADPSLTDNALGTLLAATYICRRQLNELATGYSKAQVDALKETIFNLTDYPAIKSNCKKLLDRTPPEFPPNEVD